jgi:hypothetical protein
LGNDSGSDLYTSLWIDYIHEQPSNVVHVQHELGVFGRKVEGNYVRSEENVQQCGESPQCILSVLEI